MKKIYFNRRLWAIAAFSVVAMTANYSNSAVNSQEISPILSAPANKIARNKNNTAQTLVGGWAGEPVMYEGEKRQPIAFFESDGTYSLIMSIADGVSWYVANSGTWSLENNTLYQNSQRTGQQSQGAMSFPSQNKYVYQSSTSDAPTTWQKIAPNPNLSAQQLVGTWAIESMDVRNNQIVPDLGNFTQMELNLIELNADGTFRLQSSNLTVPDYQRESTVGGTWEYVNNGFADGVLILKNPQGETMSISSVNWSKDRNSVFIVSRGKVDPTKNEFKIGKVEKLIPTDQRIN